VIVTYCRPVAYARVSSFAALDETRFRHSPRILNYYSPISAHGAKISARPLCRRRSRPREFRQRLRAEARTQFSPALGVARARGIGSDMEVRPRRRPPQKLAYRASGANWTVLSRPPPRPATLAHTCYPALALRRARGWIVWRAFARNRSKPSRASEPQASCRVGVTAGSSLYAKALRKTKVWPFGFHDPQEEATGTRTRKRCRRPVVCVRHGLTGSLWR